MRKISFYQSSFLLLLFPLIALTTTGCRKTAAEEIITPEPSEISDSVRAALSSKSVYEWTPGEKVIGFRNIDQVWNTRVIKAGDKPSSLPRQENPGLLQLKFEHNGKSYGLEDYVRHNNILGLLLIKNGNIALERYTQGNTPKSKWISFSVAKSVVSLLVGAAVKDGYIAELDAPVTDYLPQLRGSEYEKVSIRQIMQMASGVKWNEEYNDPASDIRKLITIEGLPGMLEYIRDLPRVAPSGERFNYNTAEARLVGAVLRAAIGQNLSPYLSGKIWQPFGMESDANWWLLAPDGGESGGCCISATLRDYGRIGLFAIGEQKNPSTLPAGWMMETTKPSPAADYYGSLWWLEPGNSGAEAATYAALGIFGQMIWIDPNENLVIVTHSAWPQSLGEGEDQYYGYSRAFAIAATELLKE